MVTKGHGLFKNMKIKAICINTVLYFKKYQIPINTA